MISVPAASLTHQHLGFDMLDSIDLTKRRGVTHHPMVSDLALWGRRLIRIVHQREIRHGTFIGFSRDSTTLQSWGCFAYQTSGDVVEMAGRHEDLTPGTAGGLTLADLDRPTLVPEGRAVDWRVKKARSSGRLLMVDHTYSWDAQPITELAYATTEYESEIGGWRTWWRISVTPDTQMEEVVR